MEQVAQFNGKPRDKQYLYLDEMLTRNLLKLDDIDTQGKVCCKFYLEYYDHIMLPSECNKYGTVFLLLNVYKAS